MAKIPGPSVNVIVIALRVIHKRRPQEWGVKKKRTHANIGGEAVKQKWTSIFGS